MAKVTVKLNNLTKSFDNQSFAVKEANVDIESGEFFVLVGPSGCGKSTMLRMIAGLEEITAGEILIDGKVANDIPPSKRNISMVFQNYALYPHLTVEENILFGLIVRKVPKKEQKKRLIAATDMLGMTDYLKRKPKELSGGQRQRIALARAVVSQMPICLMDEPLSNLDAKLRGQMRAEIRQLQQDLGITMIYVTHDQVEAMTMGDRIMVLKDGEVQQIGRPLDIYNHPNNEFVASFIGAPPMNITVARLNEEESKWTVGDNFNLQLPNLSKQNFESRLIHVGIRPEHLVISHEVMLSDETSLIKMTSKVNHVEVLGNETVISFDLSGCEWKAKTPGQMLYSKGDEIIFYIDCENIHIFNGISGQVINERVIPGEYQSSSLSMGVTGG